MDSKRGVAGSILCIALALAGASCAQNKKGITKESGPKKGGTFRIAATTDVDYIDPGQTYNSQTYTYMRVLVRTLVTFPITAQGQSSALVPDLATTTGSVSSDGLRWTFQLREGLRYPPGVAQGREIKSEDIRYAIERGFKPSVANGYAGIYFQDVIVGDTEYASGKAKHMAGIDVSDPKQIVFTLRRPTGDFGYRLTLPLAAPVPEELAAPHDAKTQSDYGPDFAATGPYMLERKDGRSVGYEPGKRIVFVRNPAWSEAIDPVRKAYVDRIEVTEGVTAELGTSKILSGQMDFNSNFDPPPSQRQSIITNPVTRGLLHDYSGSCIYYVFLNTTIKPFDNVNVRRAVAYAMDKNGLRLTYGGPATGDIATHVLIPGLDGFKEVGGAGYDPYGTPSQGGNLAKAHELMKVAGYNDGKYHGDPIFLAGDNDQNTKHRTDLVQMTLESLGIKVHREDFSGSMLFSKYYGVPKAGVGAGLSGWCWDYPDAFTVLKPLFDGRGITSTANNDFGLFNDSQFDELVDRASNAVGAERARLWAEADRRVMDEAAVIPTLWPKIQTLVSPRVTNATFTLYSNSLDLAGVALRSGS